jgi:hypothetical protein
LRLLPRQANPKSPKKKEKDVANRTPQDRPLDSEPRPSPGTDPTNPYRQESTGIWVSAEAAAERHNDEVGLTDRDRQERDPTL